MVYYICHIAGYKLTPLLLILQFIDMFYAVILLQGINGLNKIGPKIYFLFKYFLKSL